jgi:hypothetical protein
VEYFKTKLNIVEYYYCDGTISNKWFLEDFRCLPLLLLMTAYALDLPAKANEWNHEHT